MAYKLERSDSMKSDSMSLLGTSPEGDTTLGQLFVKDQLTGMGIRKNDSASKLSALLGQPTGPDAKFDQQTGKYYKSFTIASNRFEGVDVSSLLELFSQPGLCYDNISHTGAIVSLAAASGVHITVVGESHIEANALYDAAKARTHVFLSPSVNGPAGGVDSVGGIAFMAESSGAQEKIEELVPEHVAGLSLFGNGGKVQDRMTMDSCAGFSLLSFAEDLSEEEECVAEEEAEAPACAESAAGFTLFKEMPGTERPIEQLTAEHCNGISLYSRTEKPRDTMTADFVSGMTLLSYADDDLSEGDTATALCSDIEEEEEEPLSNKDVVDLWNVMTNCAGLTLFGHKRAEEEITFHTAETV